MADAGKWKFRGEGNACLVLVNNEEKMVYRLAKAKYWGKGHLSTNAKNKVDRIHEEMQLVVDYMKNVMQPLLTPNFVVLPELRLLENRLTEEAELQIKTHRPAQRKGKDVEHSTLDPTTLSALVMPDLCYLRDTASPLQCPSPTLSVEIKPKKAFMHVLDTLKVKSEEKSQVCKFCMHQRLKAKEGQWPVTSRYCPLDLFSGNRQRMKQALLSLAETPQNNLRICQDGEEIYGAWNKEDLIEVLKEFFGSSHNGIGNGVHNQQKLIQIFLDLVLEALLFVPEDNDYLPCELSHTNSNIVQYCQNSRYRPDVPSDYNECDTLPTGCVLERICSAQKLDSLDIDGISPVYEKLSKYISESPALRHKLCMDGPYTADEWSHACTAQSPDDSDEDDMIIEDSIPCMVNKMKRFLLSKTVQDCSIMVAMQRVPDNVNEDTVGQTLKDVCGRTFRFSVSIVDLDPKPFCKILTYVKQDEQIVSAYREACAGECSGRLDDT